MDNNNRVPNEANQSAIEYRDSLVELKEEEKTKPKKQKILLICLLLECIVAVALIVMLVVIFSNKNASVVSEEFEELKYFSSVEKEGEVKVYTSEAVEKYVAWAYGDGWHLVEQNPYDGNGKALKFVHDNGNYFHAILGTVSGTKIVDGSILPDDSYYYKTYTDTYEYEILKCHNDEIAQLAEQLSLEAKIIIEDRDPATNAYIILNNVEFDRDSQKIAEFMVEASKIVDYNMNPDVKKSDMDLNVTINLSGGDDEPYLTLAHNQTERDECDEEYYIVELQSQISEDNG